MTIQNSISNVIKGSIINGGGPGADFSTKSLSFDGVDDYMSTGSTYSELDGATKATFSMWIKPTSNASPRNIFHIGRGATSGIDGVCQLWIHQGNRIDFSINTGSTYGRANISAINYDAWNHLLIAVDLDSTDEFRCYVNGVDATTGDNLGTRTQFPSATESLLIGEMGTGLYDPFLGSIDEFAIWSGQDLRNDVSTIYNNGKPADLTSLNPTSWYRAGENSTFSYPQILMPEDTNKDKVSKYSLAFDGVGDYIDCGDADEFSFGNSTSDSPFSISAWVKLGSTSAMGIVSKYGASSSTREWLFYTNAGKPRILLVDKSNSTNAFAEGNTALSTNTFYHITCTYDGRGGSTAYQGLNIYVDGVLQSLTVSGTSYTAMHNTSQPVEIGKYQTQNFNGNIDEVSIFNSELSSTDVANIYNSGVPSDLSSYSPVGYWKLGEEAKFTDNWLVPNSALNNFSKYSFNFDGIDDFIEVADADNLSFGNGATDSPFSLSAWVKISNFNNAHIIFEKRDYINNNNNFEYVLAITSAGAINNNIYDNNVLNRRGRKTSDGLISLNTWYHIAMTYSGVGGTNASDGIKTYLNGVRVDNANNQKNTYTAMHNTNQPFRIGRILAGNIDEASVFNIELSASDVTNIYNSGTPNDISSISGLVSWWRMGEEATYDGTSNQFTIPDQGSGGNTGTSSNTMLLETLVGDTPQYYGGGISDSMDIFDRVGDAPNSENNTVSYNMEEADIVEDTP